MDWKRLLSFNAKEAQLFLLTALISAFILSDYRYIGVRELNYAEASYSFFLNFLLFSILYLSLVLVQKTVAGARGYSHSFEVWQFGPLIAVLITILSYGLIPFLYLGNLIVSPVKRLRLGYFERSVNLKDLALLGFLGPLTIFIIVLLIFEPLFFLTGNQIFQQFMIVGSFIILFSSLPLPYTNAVNVLVFSRLLWLGLILFGLISILLISFSTLYSYVVSLGLAGFMAYALNLEFKKYF